MSNRWIGRRELWLVALLAIATWTWSAAARAERRALLVGCTRYPNMPPGLQLMGPANDVRLLRAVLSKDYDFKPGNMRVLAEGNGDGLPTRANIEKEFAHLAAVAQPNDFIFILLAGHGTQQPVPGDNDPLTHYKPDGMDEVFCPRDIGGIEANRSGRIANGIVDDEMHVWLTAILKKRAFVWIIFDACHSATMIRGNDAERIRAIDPAVLLPKQALNDAQQRKSPPRAGAIPHALTGPADEKNFSYVATYACQAAETELEGRYPANNPGAEDHGLLTYALVRALEVSRRTPITYRELVQRVQSDYISMRKCSPTPLLEGPDQDRFVLDRNSAGRPLSIRLSHGDNQKWKIDAGAVHGLSQGSILAVYPPPGDSQPDQLLGHVVITRLGIPESQVAPCDAAGKLLDDPLPEAAQGGRCEVVFVDLGLDRLRFTVNDCDAAGNPLRGDQPSADEEAWKRLAGELRSLVLKDPRSLLRYVDDRKQADWLVRVGGNRVVLVPGSGWPVRAGPRGSARLRARSQGGQARRRGQVGPGERGPGLEPRSPGHETARGHGPAVRQGLERRVHHQDASQRERQGRQTARLAAEWQDDPGGGADLGADREPGGVRRGRHPAVCR